MADRRAKKGRPQVQTEEPQLHAAEERAIRMRHGLRVSDDAPLPTKDGGRADLAEQLRQMELKALEQSGRLAALRAQAAAEEEAEAAKEKIVRSLKQSSEDPSEG